MQAGRYTVYVQTAAGWRVTLQAGSFFGNTTLTKAGRSIVKGKVRRGMGVVFGAVLARPARKGTVVRVVLRRPNGTLVAQTLPLG